MNKATRFEFVTERAEAPRPYWTNSEKVMFHYFNPNGLYARQRVVTDKLFELVNEGKAYSGALISHGGDFHYDRMVELYHSKKVNWNDLATMISMWERSLENAEEFIAKAERGEAV